MSKVIEAGPGHAEPLPDTAVALALVLADTDEEVDDADKQDDQ